MHIIYRLWNIGQGVKELTATRGDSTQTVARVIATRKGWVARKLEAKGSHGLRLMVGEQVDVTHVKPGPLAAYAMAALLDLPAPDSED